MMSKQQALANRWPIRILFVLCLIWALSPWANSAAALVVGLLFRHFLGHPFLSYSQKAVKNLLKLAVVGLGFGISAQEALQVGQEGLLLTVFSISLTLSLAFIIGRLLQMPKAESHLIGSGTAICGGSAIAAVAPVINASEQNISTALGVVFILNSIALVLFPFIGQALELSQTDFGLWAAIAIHDTSSVVGAAHSYGEEALNVATTVKLARALWIIPIALLSAYWFKGEQKSIKIPYFIGGFLIAILINSYTPFPEALSSGIKQAAKALLVLTLFLIGSNLSLEQMKKAGLKALSLGVALWLIISVSSLIWILYL
ncbi:putative sulfate exporter family transporter [Saprospira sp. CCB-QB6]|nr:putative sulfate exporter family transporter [Saprospira sp. CCB-QB6]WCL82591.1 putative sulfate exporter family transporter [Saprospira sp. CCB-QB6]